MNYNYTIHALKRMDERNISKEKIEQIMETGQMFYSGDYKYVVKYLEIVGSITMNYRIIYHKSNKTIITVYTFEKKLDDSFVSYGERSKGFKKAVKNKKKAIKQQLDDEYFNEELKRFNLNK